MHNREQAEVLIKQEFRLFPKATMADLYKLFYQACLGTKHGEGRKAKFEKALFKELKQINDESIIYPSYSINYIYPIARVSLYDVLNKKVELDELVENFFRLRHLDLLMNLDEWQAEWRELEQLILQLKPKIVQDLPQDCLTSGVVPHHSEIYTKEYNPHYRLNDLFGYVKIR